MENGHAGRDHGDTSFIYLAVSDLMPWLRHEKGDFAWHTGFMAAGIAMVPTGMAVLH